MSFEFTMPARPRLDVQTQFWPETVSLVWGKMGRSDLATSCFQNRRAELMLPSRGGQADEFDLILIRKQSVLYRFGKVDVYPFIT